MNKFIKIGCVFINLYKFNIIIVGVKNFYSKLNYKGIILKAYSTINKPLSK